MTHKDEARGVPCYQHDSYHSECSDCYHPAPAVASSPDRAEELAREFHETYERLAPQFGYETRKESAKPWTDVPEKNKRLMIAVCAALLRSRMERAERWIPVSERLPNDESTVIVAHINEGRHVWFGKWDGEVWRRTDGLWPQDDKLHTKVTHWRPLPIAPDTEKKA